MQSDIRFRNVPAPSGVREISRNRWGTLAWCGHSKHKRDLKGKRQTGNWPASADKSSRISPREAGRQGCAVQLRAETATSRHEKDPGMRLSQAMTRDAYIAGQQVA